MKVLVTGEFWSLTSKRSPLPRLPIHCCLTCGTGGWDIMLYSVGVGNLKVQMFMCRFYNYSTVLRERASLYLEGNSKGFETTAHSIPVVDYTIAVKPWSPDGKVHFC